MLVSTKSLEINVIFWELDINLKVFLRTKLALRSIYPPSASPGRMNNGTVLEGKLYKTRNRVIMTTQCANGNTPGAAQKAHRAVLKKRTSHQHSVRPLLFSKKKMATIVF